MKPALLSRTLHKWLGLIIGVQLVLWTVSGFYMVVVDLDFIHGDPLVRNLQPAMALDRAAIQFGDISRMHPNATEISLRALPTQSTPVYEITVDDQKLLIDARSGEQLSPLPKTTVEALARTYYAGKGGLQSALLLQGSPPLEIQTRTLPLWRADFDDWLETSLYIHPDTGTLVTRRHRFWRWFDFFWMLHIMDYEQRTDMNNVLLRVTTVVGLVSVLSGAWLLYFSFKRRRTRAARS